jgi:hypothetical protein
LFALAQLELGLNIGSLRFGKPNPRAKPKLGYAKPGTKAPLAAVKSARLSLYKTYGFVKTRSAEESFALLLTTYGGYSSL